MFSFFKKKPTPSSAEISPADSSAAPEEAGIPATPPQDRAPDLPPGTPAPPAAADTGSAWWRKPFGGGKGDAAPPAAPAAPTAAASTLAPADFIAAPEPTAKPEAEGASRQNWMQRLKAGLRKTGSSIATVFTGTQINDALYEELEDALLMADTGVKATEHLLTDLRRRVKEAKATDPAAVKALLADALADLLRPLEKPLIIGEHQPTVVMVAGVNGAGKTTSIGKLTKHLADEGQSVLLAAADTFRAAAREQLGVWANRNTVEIVSQEGGDPAAVSFDAVTAGRARKKDVVLVDTAGRLPDRKSVV